MKKTLKRINSARTSLTIFLCDSQTQQAFDESDFNSVLDKSINRSAKCVREDARVVRGGGRYEGLIMWSGSGCFTEKISVPVDESARRCDRQKHTALSR